jgi:hypothetical protein
MGIYKKLCEQMGWPERKSPVENKQWVESSCKKINCYEYPSMKYIKTYNSIRDAERDLKTTDIKRVLSGEYKRRKNWYFEYA